MPFIQDILKYKSVSVVGLEKNTGKTETLNYILRRLDKEDVNVAITSIGVDGEQVDSVTNTPKPEIFVPEGTVFVTSHQHYSRKKLFADILDVSESSTALGRLITARALCDGRVLLSGPPSTGGIKELVQSMNNYNVKTTIVDGALSRMSLASPTVTDAMILATGATISANMPQLVRKMVFTKRLIELNRVPDTLADKLETIKKGLWAVGDDEELYDVKIPSVFLLEKHKEELFRYGNRIYVSGAVSSQLLQFLRMQNKNVELIIQDFTKIFASQEEYESFVRRDNSIKVVYNTKLIAITVNPTSPTGFSFDSETLCSELSNALKIPVYDVKKLN